MKCKHEDGYGREGYTGNEFKFMTFYCRDCDWGYSIRPSEVADQMVKLTNQNRKLKYWLERMVARSNISCMPIRGMGDIPMDEHHRGHLVELYNLQCDVEDYFRQLK